MPQRAERAPDQRSSDRTIRIRFDANVDPALPWTFAPVKRVIDTKIGETTLAYFKATNNSNAPVSGTAVFNVVPELAGATSPRSSVFASSSRRWPLVRSVEMPVTFFVDPKIVDDKDTKSISEITRPTTSTPAGEPGAAAAPASNSGS